jgi:hypothetical protein
MRSESLAIEWSISEGDFNLVLRIILFETVALNLFQFVEPGVMVGLFYI